MYRRRIIDDKLDSFQPRLRAVALEGAKAVGKTSTASQRAKTTLAMDVESQRLILQADPGLLTALPGPVLVDEWQRFPESWNLVRRAVDGGARPGGIILTGSTAPKDANLHSGAGRIVPFRMRPLSLAERGHSPTVSLAALLEGNLDVSGRSALALGDYINEITASGFPAIHGEPEDVRKLELDAYINNVVNIEFPQQGFQIRKPESLRAWLSAYAAATATTASYSDILDAATPNEGNKPAKETVMSYLEALSSLWLLDAVPAWIPARNELTRLGQSAKHHLADPALAARLMRLDSKRLLQGVGTTLRDGPILGALFESLAALSIHVYAAASDARVFHLRTRNGDHEIDFIVERDDGRILALEVKLADAAVPGSARHFDWLNRRIGGDLVGSAVLTTGEYAYQRRDGVAVIPLALLGP